MDGIEVIVDLYDIEDVVLCDDGYGDGEGGADVAVVGDMEGVAFSRNGRDEQGG